MTATKRTATGKGSQRAPSAHQSVASKTKASPRSKATAKAAADALGKAQVKAPAKAAGTRARASSKGAAAGRGAKQRRKVPNPHAREILAALREAYPDAECALEHQDPFQLLIATILSAQCTDARVNIVTRELFKKHRTPDEFAAMPQAELEEAIYSTGFFRNKATNIRAACKAIVEKHGGRIPTTMAELSALMGVGRKTANVVLGNSFNAPDGVVVDTHVKRISHKLALTDHTNPEKIERDLNQLVPHREWVMFSHRVILHGRRVCIARAPKCDECVLYAWCPTRG